MTRQTKGSLLKCAGLGLDVGAPLIATLTQFPVMIERSAEATVSGLFVVFALLSGIPLLKLFGKMIKTPSVPVIWLIGCGLLLCLRSIVDEMIVICAVGAFSNTAGAVMYKIGENIAGKDTDK
jgi:hypothetical protein